MDEAVCGPTAKEEPGVFLREIKALVVALFADIHANDLALEACLAHAKSLNAEQYVFLGDLVGYGPAPEAVVQRVADLAASGATVIKGNHDAAVHADDGYMNPIAAAAITWTRGMLSDHAKQFLAALPLAAQLGELLFVHADASAPVEWNYVTNGGSAKRSLAATAAGVTFCGHVHVPQVYARVPGGELVTRVRAKAGCGVPLAEDRQWLVVVGSVGQPRDGDPAAAFATYDTSTRMLSMWRVGYDVPAIIARMRAKGLPDSLVRRLAVGM